MKSTKNFEQPTVISTFEPSVFLLSKRYRGRWCDGCFQKCTLTPCEGCAVFNFCTKSCQEKYAYLHKHECIALKGNASKIHEIKDDALYLLRLYNYFQTDEGRNAVGNFLGTKRTFSDLMSNRDNINKDIVRCGQFLILSGQIKNFIGGCSSLPDAGELYSTFGKMVSNSFSILDEDQNGKGTGLYLGASVLNHSCDANCLSIFSGLQLLITSNRPIKKDDELTISYIEQMNTTKTRQELFQNYYFKCTCIHCKDTERDTKMIGLKAGYEDYHETIRLEYVEMEKKVVKLQHTGVTGVQEIFDLSKNMFSKWSDKLNPQSVYVYKCLTHYHNSCIELDLYDKAASVASKMIKIHSTYIQCYHPKRALDIGQFAKTLLYLGNFKKSLEYCLKGEKEVEKIFGKDYYLYKALMIMKQQCVVEGRL